MSGDQPPPPGWQPTRPPGAAARSPGATPRWRHPGQPPYPGAAAGPRQYPSSPTRATRRLPTPTRPARPVAHKPGAIPLRPLVLSDIFDGAFRIIRYNPKATIGAAVLVSAVAMVRAGRGRARQRLHGRPAPRPRRRRPHRQPGGRACWSRSAGSLAGTQLQSIGLLFVSGMIAHVTLGRRGRPQADHGRGLGGHPRQAVAAARDGRSCSAWRCVLAVGWRSGVAAGRHRRRSTRRLGGDGGRRRRCWRLLLVVGYVVVLGAACARSPSRR